MTRRAQPILWLTVFAVLPSAAASAQGVLPGVRRIPPPSRTAVETEVEPTDEAQPTVEAKPSVRRAIQAADYGRWESLGRTVLAPDGRWLAYQVSRTSGEDELRLRMLATDSTETIAYASGPKFASDGTWLAYLIGVSEAEREKASKAGKPIPRKLGLRNLVDGRTSEIENVASFVFSEDGGALVMRRPKGKDQKHGGVDIVVRDLATGRDTAFGNVANHVWNDEQTLLAMVIDTADGVGSGVQVYDASSGRLDTLDSHDDGYVALTWREDAADLAVLRRTDHDAEKDEEPSHVVLSWHDLEGDSPRRREYDHREDESFPDAKRIVDFAGLRWSDDGQTLYFGIADWDKRPVESDDDDDAEGKDGSPRDPKKTGADRKPSKDGALRETLTDPSNVEVWHASDVDIIPRQKRTAGRDRRESHLCAWWPEDALLVRLGTDLTEDVGLMEEHKRAIGLDNTPHETQRMFGPTLNDVYVIDVATGERIKVRDQVKYSVRSCPSGRYLIYVREGEIWSYDLDEAVHVDLTGAIDSEFVNQEVTNLTDEKPPYGIAAWTEDGQHVLVYDRYDMWMLAADGSEATRLTDGAERHVRHRRVVLDPEDEEFVDPQGEMWVSLYGDRTKKSGYGRVRPGDPTEVLCFEDRSVSRLSRAKDAEVYAWVEQAFDDPPDIVVAGADLDDGRQVSEINPFHGEYAWGRSELIDFVNDHDESLQGALFYPADYEEGRTYPMIVYIYERLSQTVHGYTSPTERHPYNTAVFTAEGYFVFRPDIVYRPQNPGLSAVECVVPAVRKVLETGMIDEERIGLIGHSWGAYQTAFIVTQTDLFAAGIAGAPLTNMMSMSMSVYWNSGQTNAWIFHESQGRMDRPFWKDVDTYIRNSPIFSIDDLNTPLMIAFGTEDGAVDFNQGVELYNAARLTGKQFVMLVYPGENHSLRQKPNQVDYHYRVLEWFGHYLKGEDAKPWILDGVDHLDREREIKEMKDKKKRRSDGSTERRGERTCGAR